MEQDSVSGAQCQDQRPWAQIGEQEVPSEHPEHFCAVRVMEPWHRLPRGCVVSSLELSQSRLPMGLGPDLCGSAGAVLGQGDPEDPATVILW